MKKIQSMMLMLLVAVMGMCVQSCGSDDDNTPSMSSSYTMNVVLDVKDKGSLSNEQLENLKNKFTQTGTAQYISDYAAKQSSRTAVQAAYDEIKAAFSDVDWSDEKADFAIVITTTNNSTQKEIAKSKIIFNKGITLEHVI